MSDAHFGCDTCEMVMLRLSSGDYSGADWYCHGLCWICKYCRDSMENGRLLAKASSVISKFVSYELRPMWDADLTDGEILELEVITRDVEERIAKELAGYRAKATVPPGQSHDDEGFKP